MPRITCIPALLRGLVDSLLPPGNSYPHRQQHFSSFRLITVGILSFGFTTDCAELTFNKIAIESHKHQMDRAAIGLSRVQQCFICAYSYQISVNFIYNTFTLLELTQ